MTLMTAFRSFVLTLALVSGASLAAHQAAQPAAPKSAASQQAVRTKDVDSAAVTAIVVDVVVRDRDGNPVTGLTASDFELTEDKVLQEVGSFTAVNRPGGDAPEAPAAPAAQAAVKPAADTAAAPQVIALLFDRLTPDAKALTHKAAMNYIGDTKVARNVVGIFGIDLSLIFQFGDRLPREMRQEHERLARAVEQAIKPPDMTQVPA